MFALSSQRSISHAIMTAEIAAKTTDDQKSGGSDGFVIAPSASSPTLIVIGILYNAVMIAVGMIAIGMKMIFNQVYINRRE